MARNSETVPEEDKVLIERLVRHLRLREKLWSPEEIGVAVPISPRTLRRWRDEEPTEIQPSTRRRILATLARDLEDILEDAGIPLLDNLGLPPTGNGVVDGEG